MVKKHKRVYLVDAISSYAGLPINMRLDKADFLMSTSNKCIQGMAGLAFVVSRKKELRKLRHSQVHSSNTIPFNTFALRDS